MASWAEIIATNASLLEESMKQSIARANLDTTKHYALVRKDSDPEYVGQFVRSYRMGSGDGMTIHWEFMKNGSKIVINDDMWGSFGIPPIIGFKIVPAPSE
jgi:hypothetical protein